MKLRLGNLPPRVERILVFLSKKYVILLLVFVIWAGIFDANSLVNILSARHRVKELGEKKAYYQQQIDEEQRRLDELHTSRENLEKFARQQYYMRRANEDIYVVVEK